MALREPDTATPPVSPATTLDPPERSGRLSPLTLRRLRNFRANSRAYWSLIIFSVLFGISLIAELVANQRPIVMRFQGETYFPVFQFYPGTEFGDFNATEALYNTFAVRCFIRSGGVDACYQNDTRALEILAELQRSGTVDGVSVDQGWMLWPPIQFYHRAPSNIAGVAPGRPGAYFWLGSGDDTAAMVDTADERCLRPDGSIPQFVLRSCLLEGAEPELFVGRHVLGTDNTSRDVLARVIYGVRLSVAFALVVTVASSIIGIIAGAIQGFFGGLTDLLFQRFIEIWSSVPTLYVIIILAAFLQMSFGLLAAITVTFGWIALVGVVRAEFLRARNFEYVRAARALGVSNWKIMFRHVLPNAMVATLTFLPFQITAAIGGLASLDFLGFGLPSNSPSLGELTQQAYNHLQSPWLAFTAFLTVAILLSLLVFIFEGVRDAYDPRKTFAK